MHWQKSVSNEANRHLTNLQGERKLTVSKNSVNFEK